MPVGELFTAEATREGLSSCSHPRLISLGLALRLLSGGGSKPAAEGPQRPTPDQSPLFREDAPRMAPQASIPRNSGSPGDKVMEQVLGL